MLWAYAFGKPTDKLQVGGPDDQLMVVEIINNVRPSSGGAAAAETTVDADEQPHLAEVR